MSHSPYFGAAATMVLTMHKMIHPITRYPWRTVLPALAGAALLLALGTALIDSAFVWHTRQGGEDFSRLPGTCYYAGDTRNYTRIALDGYSNYAASSMPPHLTALNDRSWWPLFPNVVARVIDLGGGVCSSRVVNGVAFLALIPIFQALMDERRWWRLLVIGVLPFGAWLYIGAADTFFLALSGLLILAIQRSERHPVAAGFGALILGIVVGLAKANALVLIPPLIVWGLARGAAYWRQVHGAAFHVRTASLLLHDSNPGWTPLLGALGLLLGTTWWIYQTSGMYPYYVLLLQRTLWWKEFEAGSLSSLGYTFYTALNTVRQGAGGMLELQRMSELASLVLALALAAASLPPRWPGGVRIVIPFHWRIGILMVYLMMFMSGQSHAVERYAVSNVFFVLAWYRVLFGAAGQSVSWRPWTLPGLLRWLWLIAGPALWLLAWLQLGWEPLN